MMADLMQLHIRKSPLAYLAGIMAVVGIAGCQITLPPQDNSVIAARLTQRFGQTTPDQSPQEFTLPPGASLAEGVTEDQAIAIALWNNAAFHEMLTEIGLARGDLIQAGLLPNPEFVFYSPMSEKPYKYLLDFPIEALWLRPIRIRSAERDSDRTVHRLTQAGLDLMRDVRQAYADVVLAKERVRIAGEAVKLRLRIAELAEKRLKEGDISKLEAATTRIDALQAEQDAVRLGFEVPILEERLRHLMGMGRVRDALVLKPSSPPATEKFDVDALTAEAMQTRPDALAAIEAVAAATARVEFAKTGWVRLLGIVDATSGKDGNVVGPAVRFTIPVFNQNQGAIARAEAELQRALGNQKTVAAQIILDVRRAHLLYQQASAEIDIVRTKVRPEVEASIQRSQAAYEQGNVPVFVVLESTRQLFDSYLREAQLQGDLRRSWAELERSIGRRLGKPAPSTQEAAPATTERTLK
jgi:cobalt-zinc-cadmium efflux system outer membrane protein